MAKLHNAKTVNAQQFELSIFTTEIIRNRNHELACRYLELMCEASLNNFHQFAQNEAPS